MGRARLELRSWRRPAWRRRGAWFVAGLAAAGSPLVAAGVVWLAPVRVPVRPADAPVGEGSALRAPARGEAGAEALAPIAALNLFSPTRADWPAAALAEGGVEDAEARRLAAERLKAAHEQADRLTFLAVVRVGEDRRAILDFPDRPPDGDLLRLGVGDAWNGWEAASITGDTLTLRFETGDERTLTLAPRTRRPAERSASRGRSVVEVREAPVAGTPMFGEPITPEEARRRIERRLGAEETRVRELLDELLLQIQREREADAREPAPQ